MTDAIVFKMISDVIDREGGSGWLNRLSKLEEKYFGETQA